MGAIGSDESRIVQVRFQPLWHYIDGIREFCRFFTRTTFDEEDVGHRVGMVVHELIENAIRYSSRDAKAVLDLSVYAHDDDIEIRVVNSAEPEQVAEFQEVYARVMDGDPREVYIAAMTRARSLPDHESGLGLPRVRFEGKMELALTLTDPNLVEIRAKGKL